MKLDLESLKSHLSRYGQEHLVAFWDQLNDTGRCQLAEQISGVDFEQLRQLQAGSDQTEDWANVAARASSPPAIRLDAGADEPRFSPEQARERGESLLRRGRVAVVLVAGGQGSRLGFEHPKGIFPLGPVSQRTLFEIHVDRLRALSARFSVTIPLYLMTSPATHDETVAFFHDHNRLGLAEEDVVVFCQGTMPAVDCSSGRALLESPDRLFLSPDGHGGTLAALAKAGCLEDMRRRGVDCLFYFQVDNPLVAIAEPKFLGYHSLAESELTSQVVAKTDPLEKVGNVVSVDGQLRIIEYSDLPEQAARSQNPDGSLAIWAGSIAVHAFDVAFLQRMREQSDSLPFHRARKIVPFIDADGQRVEPETPNAIKFERFIFDLLPSSANALVVEVAESEAFAPLKNAIGAPKDTEETCRAAMVAQQTSWLLAAGVGVAGGVLVEINPLHAQDADEVAEKFTSGTTITTDTYFN